MGKTYVEIVKYLIRASLEVDGIVEKPDIVGAIFGQTEGLLGDDLDLRELQKNGRIGRIEVDTNVRGGKCIGQITVPSSLDMVETSILAAALEVVDRVGPCDARIVTQKIEDTRNLKRKQVLGRARDLLKNLVTSEIPESKELSEMVREELKIADVISYGAEGLPAGPGIDSNEELIIVEGRADVINLLKNGIKNVIGLGGAKVGRTVLELAKRKEVTAFLDGDRGGDIILKELMTAGADLDYVARAPIGHEVEELSRKEINQCVRRRITIEQVRQQTTGSNAGETMQLDRLEMAPAGIAGFASEPAMQRDTMRRGFDRNRGPDMRDMRRDMPRPRHQEPVNQPPQMQAQAPAAPVFAAPSVPRTHAPPEVEGSLKSALKELEGTLRARLLDEHNAPIEEVPIRDVMASLAKVPKVHAVVLDGIVTQRLVDAAEGKGAKFVAGIRAGNALHLPAGLGMVLNE